MVLAPFGVGFGLIFEAFFFAVGSIGNIGKSPPPGKTVWATANMMRCVTEPVNLRHHSARSRPSDADALCCAVYLQLDPQAKMPESDHKARSRK